MKIQRSRYYLGGIGILLLLMVGTLWAMAALASPSGQTAGIIEFVDSTGDLLTHVSPDTSLTTGDRTVTAKVTDPALSKLIGVGPDDDRARTVTVTVGNNIPQLFVEEIYIDVTSGTGLYYAGDTSGVSRGTVNYGGDDADGSDGVTPIVGNVSIDYDASSIDEDDPEVEIIDVRTKGGKQLIYLKVNEDLSAGNTISLVYNTSDTDGALAAIRGEADVMYLGLAESIDQGIGDQGVFKGKFIVADGVTIDINDIKEEQHTVAGGLQTGLLRTETLRLATGAEGDIIGAIAPGVVAGKIQDGATFDVHVKYPNIKLVDEDGEDASATDDAADIVRRVSGADVKATRIGGEGGDRRTVTFEADKDIELGSTVVISYSGDDRFTITLEHGPAQSGSLSADGNLFEASNISVPQPGTGPDGMRDMTVEESGALYTFRGFDNDTNPSKLTFSVNEDTPARGTVIGVTYRGVEEIIVRDIKTVNIADPGDPPENRMRFTTTLFGNPDIDYPTDPNASTGLGGLIVLLETGDTLAQFNSSSSVPDLVVVTGDTVADGATPADMESGISVTFEIKDNSEDDGTIPPDALPVENGDTLYVYGNIGGPMLRSRDVSFNPAGAMAGGTATGPIVKETSVGEIRGTYDDETHGAVSTKAVVEDESPSFGSEQPANGSSFGTANVPSLSIVITDQPAGDDGSGLDIGKKTMVFYVTTRDATDLITDPGITGAIVNAASTDLVATADFTTDDLGVVTATLPLVNDPDKRLGNFRDLSKMEGAETVRWWAQVSDKSGNKGTSDSIPDDEDAATPKDAGNNPYTLIVDSTAPKVDAEQSATGLWYDGDEDEAEVDDGMPTGGRLKEDMRTSIGIGFDDAIDADSVDADDFVVMVGGAAVEVTGVSVRNGVKVFNNRRNAVQTHNYVFLSLAEALAADAVPVVSVVATDDRIVNEAGNMLATGDMTIRDGIAPKIDVMLSAMVSKKELDIVVSTDEDIVNIPEVTLSLDGNTAKGAVGRASRTTGSNEWIIPVSITKGADTDGVYNVMVSARDDISRPRNMGMAGNPVYTGDGAITFEIDTVLAKPEDSSFDPTTGDEVGENGFIFLEFTWDDKKEYTGDSHDDVMLTTLVLDSGDDNERDILDQATPEGAGTKFSVGVADLGLDEHTLFVNAEDSAGNTLKKDVEITFKVTKVAVSLELKRGISHISIPRNPRDRDINAVFGDAMEVQTVFTFDGGESLAAFRDPATGAFVGSLKNIDAGHAYGVEVTGTVKVEIPVPPLSGGGTPPSVTVSKGWNFVPVITLDDLNDVKQGTVLDADDYLGFNWTSGWTFQSSRWYQIHPDTKNEDIDLTDKKQGKGEVLVGSGYWVYFAAADTLTPGTFATAPATE